MARNRKMKRDECVMARFTVAEIALIEKYADKLEMTKSEFVACSAVLACESDISLKIIANMIMPTVKALRYAKAFIADKAGVELKEIDNLGADLASKV